MFALQRFATRPITSDDGPKENAFPTLLRLGQADAVAPAAPLNVPSSTQDLLIEEVRGLDEGVEGLRSRQGAGPAIPARRTEPAPTPDRLAALAAFETPLHASLGPLLTGLTDHSSALQQKMLNRHHQNVMMILTLNVLHRAQVAQAREDFDRLYHLTQDLQALHLQTIREVARLADQLAAPALGAGAGTRAVDIPALPAPRAARIERFRSPQPSLTAAGPPVEAETQPTAHSGPRTERRDHPASRTAALPESGPMDNESGQNMLLELNRRIAGIQQDRQGRWRWLFTMLTGGSKEQPLP